LIEHPAIEFLHPIYDKLIGAATRIVPLEWLSSSIPYSRDAIILQETVDYEHS